MQQQQQQSSQLQNRSSSYNNNQYQNSKGVAQNERGEFVTIGEIEELPPTGNFKGSMSQFSRGVEDSKDYNMAEQIRRGREEEREANQAMN